MEKEYKINLGAAYLISKSKKVFILFNVENNTITQYKLTNDLTRYRLNYQHFRLLEITKLNKTTIKL